MHTLDVLRSGSSSIYGIFALLAKLAGPIASIVLILCVLFIFDIVSPMPVDAKSCTSS